MNIVKAWYRLLRKNRQKKNQINLIADDMDILDFDHQPFIDCYLTEDFL